MSDLCYGTVYRAAWVCVLVGWAGLRVLAQQPGAGPIGEVATRDARVSGGLEVQGTVARLLSNVSVTANDHDAPVTLARGGRVLVCPTSEFHLLRSGAEGGLIFGLDRGALEINTGSRRSDAVLTPDLKFVPVTIGPLDLKLRVTREGDTCVENAGATAPVLSVSDPFSAATYRILPGQHLLFVKGDLHRVVDHERSSCGCPTTAEPRLAQNGAGPSTPAQAAAVAHPFPQAQSEGLAPTPEAANEAPVGVASSQVSTTFSYGDTGGQSPGIAEAPGSTGATGTSGAAASTAQPVKPGFFHAIGHFFHRLFGGS